MLYCSNKDTGYHVHSTFEDAFLCWDTPALYVTGGALPTRPPVAPPASTSGALPVFVPGPPPVPKPRWWDDPTSGSQEWRVEKEGGSRKRAKTFTKGQTSQYIDALQYGKCRKEPDPPEDEPSLPPVPPPPPVTAPVSPAPTSHSEGPSRRYVHGHWAAKTETIVMVPLLERVPDGRFAVSLADEPPTFLRVVRPKGGKWANCLKVQTQHAERYEEAWCKFDDEQIAVFKPSIEDFINLLITDYRGAARLYAKIKTRCARCNIELTDDRSRHYGIGPECEKYWPWMITQVDEEEELRKAEA